MKRLLRMRRMLGLRRMLRMKRLLRMLRMRRMLGLWRLLRKLVAVAGGRRAGQAAPVVGCAEGWRLVTAAAVEARVFGGQGVEAWLRRCHEALIRGENTNGVL